MLKTFFCNNGTRGGDKGRGLGEGTRGGDKGRVEGTRGGDKGRGRGEGAREETLTEPNS